jgi:hypothetical protein
VVPPPGSYFELISFVSYQKLMQFVELIYSLVCSSLGRSRPGGRTWTSSGRSATSHTLRLSGNRSPTSCTAGSLVLCFRDCEFWMTKTSLVHDMYVEEYHVERVMRQFNLYQA